MFDFAWSEIALIGIVALVAIGPKDLPVAIKAVAQMVKKARKMAGEFQTHVDEMVREANLGDVKNTFDDLRRMDIKGKILSAVDDDGSIRKTLSEPVASFSPAPPPVPVHDVAVASASDGVQAEIPASIDAPLPEVTVADKAVPVAAAPAFVPPRYAPSQAARPAPVPPAFIPPAFAPASAVPIDHG